MAQVDAAAAAAALAAADAAAAAQVGFLGALGAHDTNRRATDLPLFYARTDKDVCTARQFITRFETAAEVANWNNDVRKCQQFSLLLRSDALSWFSVLELIPNFQINNWNQLKNEFLSAYAPRYTARATCTNFNEMQQRAGESVQTFYVRAMDVYVKLKAQRGAELTQVRHVNVAGATNDQTRAAIKLEGIEDTSRFFMQQLFVAGLKEEIREKVMERDPRTLQTSLEEARAMELIVMDKKNKPRVTAVKENSDDEGEEQYTEEEEAILERVNAIFRKNGKNPSRYFKRNGQKSFKPNPNIQCRGCGKKGHIEKYCWAAKKTNTITERDNELMEEEKMGNLSIEDYYRVSSIRKAHLN